MSLTEAERAGTPPRCKLCGAALVVTVVMPVGLRILMCPLGLPEMHPQALAARLEGQ